jgi:hypothetical protein
MTSTIVHAVILYPSEKSRGPLPILRFILLEDSGRMPCPPGGGTTGEHADLPHRLHGPSYPAIGAGPHRPR